MMILTAVTDRLPLQHSETVAEVRWKTCQESITVVQTGYNKCLDMESCSMLHKENLLDRAVLAMWSVNFN